MGRRARLAAVASVLGLGAGLNAVVYAHARAMLWFDASDGARTAAPEALSAVERAKVVVTGVSLPRPRLTRSPADVGLPFETVGLHAADGVALEAWWVPAAGPPAGRALLFHGYGGAKDQLLDIASWWHDRGWEVGLVDFRGAGGSSGDHTTLGWEEARDVAALVSAARARGPEPIVLYGFSMGGAAVLAALGPGGVQVEGAVVEATYASMVGTVRNRFALMGLPGTPLSELLVFWGGVAAGFDGFALRPVDFAAQVSAPVAVIHGEDDRRAPPADGAALAAALGEADSLVVLPRTGHQPGLSTRPPEWGQAVAALARRATGGQRAADRSH